MWSLQPDRWQMQSDLVYAENPKLPLATVYIAREFNHPFKDKPFVFGSVWVQIWHLYEKAPYSRPIILRSQYTKFYSSTWGCKHLWLCGLQYYFLRLYDKLSSQLEGRYAAVIIAIYKSLVLYSRLKADVRSLWCQSKYRRLELSLGSHLCSFIAVTVSGW